MGAQMAAGAPIPEDFQDPEKSGSSSIPVGVLLNPNLEVSEMHTDSGAGVALTPSEDGVTPLPPPASWMQRLLMELPRLVKCQPLPRQQSKPIPLMSRKWR